MKKVYLFFSLLLLCLAGNTQIQRPPLTDNWNWTWISGLDDHNTAGIYGTRGMPSASNFPGAREGAVSWLDNTGKLWLFGGAFKQATQYRNDLWVYNPVSDQWTWMNGSMVTNEPTTYSPPTVVSINTLGARADASGWKDLSGNFWLFGGNLGQSYYNDLWRYDASANRWILVRSSGKANAPGIYNRNKEDLPGARKGAVTWVDGNGDLWLFGGEGYGDKSFGLLNDLWTYDIKTGVWTWVKGAPGTFQPGRYGSKMAYSTNSTPGARESAVGWTDKEHNLWLFGGDGYAATDSRGLLNDLWKFDVAKSTWIWAGGDQKINQPGVYGVKHTFNATIWPGARSGSIGFGTTDGVLYLFAGYGYDGKAAGSHNDLWELDPATQQWKWISGDNATDQPANYGRKKQSSAANRIGARDNGVGWTDKAGVLWTHGGTGFNATTKSDLNDLWKFYADDLGCPASVEVATDTLTCSRTVNNIDPKINVYNDGQSPQLLVNFTLTGATTGSGVGSVSGKRFNKGVTTVTYRVSYDTSIVCRFTVTVADRTAPVPKMAALPQLVAECSLTVVPPMASDNCDGAITGTTKDPLVYNKQGRDTITWTFTDASGNTSSQQQIVIIKDISKPVPALAQLPDITGDCSVSVSSSPSAIDNCAGKLTATTNDSTTFTTPGTRTIKWIYDDGNGNSTTQGQRIIVQGSSGTLTPALRSLPDLIGQCAVTITARPTANKGCGFTVTGTTRDPLSYTRQGIFQVNWSYIDGKDTVTQQQRVIIKDTTAPAPELAQLPDITGDCIATVATAPFATDNCSGRVTATTKDSLVYRSAGTFTVTWRFTDGNNNVSEQVQRVIVKGGGGTFKPTLDVLPDLTGQCTVTVAAQPTASRACGGTLTAITREPLVYDKQGSFTVNWLYIDGRDTITQRQRVIVKDNQLPVPFDTTMKPITGECAVRIVSIPEARDNCAGVVKATTSDSLVYTKPGTYTITWTFDDGHNNLAERKQQVVVTGSTGALVPTLSSLPELRGECSVTVSARPTASRNCTGLITGTTTDPLSYSQPGKYTINWSYTDGSTQLTQQQTIVVEDVTPPVPARQVLDTLWSDCALTVTAVPTATDRCSGLVSGMTADPLNYSASGQHVITWTFTDASNNKSQQQQVVIITGNPGALVPVLPTLPDITGECAVTISTRPAARKNCGGLINATTSDPLSYDRQGTYNVQWIYTDGNETITQVQRVVVADHRAPAPLLASLPDVTGNCSAEIIARPLAFDSCSGRLEGTTTDPLTYNVPGKYLVTWSYTDLHGNITTQQQQVVVKGSASLTAVEAVLPDITGQCSATVTKTPEAIRNCGGIIRATTTDPLSYQEQGIFMVNWTYTDEAGNRLVQQQRVVIKDNAAPVPQQPSLPDLTASCSLLTPTPPTAIDACTGVITATTTNALSFTRPGAYTIRWIFDDGHKNKTEQEQRVIIKNTTPPVPTLANLPDITGDCSAEIRVAPTARGTCGNIIRGITSDPLLYQQPGTYTVTWIYSDGAGNSVTQNQRVIVKSLSLKLHVFPNPSANYFNITARSCNRQEPLILNVYDGTGRLVETMKLRPDETVAIGSGYPGTLFFAQLVQGQERLVMKLLKF